MKIVEFEEKYIKEVKLFLDKYSGIDYLTEIDLKNIVKNKSRLNNKNCSYLAIDNDRVIGVRITFAPSKWINSSKGLSIEKWRVNKDSVAKFHCLFVADGYQGKGIGPMLSEASIGTLLDMKAEAIISHSWLESPNNSSQKYLLKYGFKGVKIHKLFWHDLDYFCTGCQKKKCICSAEEMIFYLS